MKNFKFKSIVYPLIFIFNFLKIMRKGITKSKMFIYKSLTKLTTLLESTENKIRNFVLKKTKEHYEEES